MCRAHHRKVVSARHRGMHVANTPHMHVETWKQLVLCLTQQNMTYIQLLTQSQKYCKCIEPSTRCDFVSCIMYGLKATSRSVCCDTNRLNRIFEEPRGSEKILV